MTVAELLPSLESVHSRGPGRFSARCPAHADKSPSLSVMEGDKGILLRCFAGCSLRDITQKLGLQIKDLFFDQLSADPQQRREAMHHRAEARAARQAEHETEGRRLDTLRQAEHLIQSARGISIEEWSNDKLNAELNRLGNAYALLESEDSHE